MGVKTDKYQNWKQSVFKHKQIPQGYKMMFRKVAPFLGPIILFRKLVDPEQFRAQQHGVFVELDLYN